MKMSKQMIAPLTEHEEEIVDTDKAIQHCFELAKSEDMVFLEQYISNHKYLIDLISSYGQSALHMAAASENLVALKNLVTLGWSVNLRDGDAKTALHIGWYEALVYLLAQGADQSMKDGKGRIGLHLSTYDHQIRCMALLVQEIQPQLVNSTDKELMTPLHWAAFHNRPDHVQLLISKGANLYCSDVDQKTALHWACQQGSRESVDVLIQESRGTNLVNVRDKSGKGALHYASAAGHHEVIAGLNKSQVLDLNLDDTNDRQPLHWAAGLGRLKCVQMLIQLGADPTAHDVNARNALHLAKKAKNEDCAQYLKAVLKAMKQKQKSGTRYRHHRVAAAPLDNRVKDYKDEAGEDNQQVLSKTEAQEAEQNTSIKLPPLRRTGHLNGVLPHSEMNEDQVTASKELSPSESA